ncbi:MAG: DUF192 domain-containing protein [Actinomycetota bacterium]
MRRAAILALAAAAFVAACASDDDGASDTSSDAVTTEVAAADDPLDDASSGDPVTEPGDVDAGDGDPDDDGSDDGSDDPNDTSTPADDPVEDATGDAEQAKADPARTAGAVDAPAGVRPDGFTTATVRITSDAGDVCEVCLWLADVGSERNRGLMGVTDLGQPVGMLFEFEEPTAGNFFMFGTPMPLSIAWFAADGTHVDETDMTPCLVEDSAVCERYGPGADYVWAIEMVEGELDVVGIGPGSSIEVLAEHDVCPELG